MSWQFSRALVEEYLEDQCLDGAQFALSNANQAPPRFYSTDRTLATCHRSRFGMTCGLLTDDRGEELLTWFLADFPVRTSAWQEAGPESTANDQGSGEKWPASFARWDRDTSTWRTPQLSLLGVSGSYSETWPRWGMMRDGECSALTMPQSRKLTERLRSLTTGTGSGSLVRERAPTPTVCGNYNRKGVSAKSGDGLETWVRERVPTPTAQDAANNGGPSQREQNTPPLNAIVGGLLNPDWVEWLMGWPIGWTDLDNDDPGVHGFDSEPPGVPRTTSKRDRRAKRLKAIGNGQVPQCAALAWNVLSDPHRTP